MDHLPSLTFDLLRSVKGGRGESVVRSYAKRGKYMVKSTIMLMGHLDVPRTPVSWPIKAKRLAPIPRMGCLCSPASPRILVERPSPNDEASQHLCLDKGYDNEPSRDVLQERGYIAHIRSISEEKDEAGQRRYPARRWVVERTLGWLSKCQAILMRYEKKAPTTGADQGGLHPALVPAPAPVVPFGTVTYPLRFQ